MPPWNVVITGAAIVSPLGLTRKETFEAVLAGRCGMTRLSAIECDLPDGRDGGEAPPLPADFMPGAPREVRYLRKSITDALADARLSPQDAYVPHRCAVILGTTLHGMRAAGVFLRTGDFSCLSRFLAAPVLAEATRDLNLNAFAATTCSACSSSLGSIALGVTLLASGEYDLVIAGGYDPVSEYAYAGFNSLRLVSELPLRPFTRERQGMKLSEGYGIVVLERAGDARGRGARAIARIAGFGESADAHHLTQPHPEGQGAARAMRQALESAGMAPSDIGLLIAHATGTPDNDASEYAAMKSVFAAQLPQIPCVGFKSHLGHTLGGAGAVELILGAMALEQQVVPPCANVTPEGIEFSDLAVSHTSATPAKLRATLSTSLGFGGANTCMILTPPDTEATPARPLQSTTVPSMTVPPVCARDRDPIITGIGVLVPGAVGNDALLQLLDAAPGELTPQIPEELFAHLINARRARRLSDYVKLLLAATTLALQDAQVNDVAAFAEGASAILGTTHGSTNYCESYYRQVVTEGFAAANPMLFAEGVPNAGSAHVSLALGIKGACQTLIGSRTAGLDALALAARRIRTGCWTRAIVGAAEEYSALTQDAYRACDATSASRVVSGAVVFIVESRASAAARNAPQRGMIASAASRTPGAAHLPNAIAETLAAIGYPPVVARSAFDGNLARVEELGLQRACRDLPLHPGIQESLAPRVGELFSAAPLLAIAAGLLRHTPDLGAICTDITGIASAIRIKEAS